MKDLDGCGLFKRHKQSAVFSTLFELQSLCLCAEIQLRAVGTLRQNYLTVSSQRMLRTRCLQVLTDFAASEAEEAVTLDAEVSGEQRGAGRLDFWECVRHCACGG